MDHLLNFLLYIRTIIVSYFYTHLFRRLLNSSGLLVLRACSPMVEYFPCTEEVRVRFTAGPSFYNKDEVLVNIHIQLLNWNTKKVRKIFSGSDWEHKWPSRKALIVFMFNEISNRDFPLEDIEKNILLLIYTVRQIAWFWLWWKTWQAAISFGELHASFDPKISELRRDANIRRELKHLSTGRKRKQKWYPY